MPFFDFGEQIPNSFRFDSRFAWRTTEIKFDFLRNDCNKCPKALPSAQISLLLDLQP